MSPRLGKDPYEDAAKWKKADPYQYALTIREGGPLHDHPQKLISEHVAIFGFHMFGNDLRGLNNTFFLFILYPILEWPACD